MRKRIYYMIESAGDSYLSNQIYDVIMIITIFASLLPLAFKEITPAMAVIDTVTTSIFIVDYVLRWVTADIKLERGWTSFIRYPFTGMAIIDLLSVLPTLLLLNPALKVLKIFRLIRALRVMKIFKSFRYSKNIAIIAKVFKNQKRSLITVGVLAVGYILMSALVVFNVEPETFKSFFDAVYWSTISLTTVGYGDIYTTTAIGRMITMLSSLFGVAIVALPAGIITAGYMNELNNENDADGGEK